MSESGTHPPDGSQSGGQELNCEESLARVYEYLDGELDTGEHDAVRLHLEKCRRCYPHFDFERLFLDYVHELGAEQEARPGLKDRVLEMLEAETR
ncbi:MAG: zf-HC2 domain-containing protein [Gemmatimonadetes bacterium]|nr:zf-HC2 domain-containing protein [Gemmatimonadota bacterium]MBT8479034.1 zf-HC2 domain-containing protein [Gemmatimonadota bacterium]